MATAYTTQANFDTLKNADAHAQGLDGGLNLKTDPKRLAPPATTRADNAWYQNPGNVQQLPALTSTMPANTQHIYNLHARDIQQPSTMGDVMVHGEVTDGSGGNYFTSPVWSDGNGQTLCTAQPMPPWNQRTKVLTGRMTRTMQTITSPGISTDQQPLMAFRQESGYSASSPQRYGLAYHDGSKLNVTFGLVDGQIETPETLTASFNANYAECAGVQGTNYWVCASISGTILTINSYDFKGNSLGTPVTLTVCAAYNASSANTYAPFTILQHAGRTYLAYVDIHSSATYMPAFYDIVTKATLYTPISTVAPPTNGGFSAASPYTHQAPPNGQKFYCAVQFNNNVYLLSQTSVGGTISLAGSGIALPVATNTGYNSAASPTGTVNWQSTMAVTIFDSNGGYGSGASLGVVCFRHYPEQVSTAWNTTWYQSLSVSTFSYVANAGLGTSLWQSIANNYVRMPSGVALVSKAFSYNPPETNFAGPVGAKNAFCLIRCGAFEPYKGLSALYTGTGYFQDWTYGQPTYFIIDHQARIVGRAFESQGPLGAYNTSAYSLANQGYNAGSSPNNNFGSAVQVTGLSAPLLTATNNDLSLLDLMFPVWVQTQSDATAKFPNNNVDCYTAPPSNVVMQPAAVSLSVSSQVAQCPPVQAGPYTVLSGPMTCIHDGRGVVEANYHFGAFNPVVVSTQTNTAAYVGPSGAYYYAVIYEWSDSLGRVHRSVPSVPVGANVTGGGFGSVTIAVPPPVTVKTAVGGQLLMRVYRSSVNNTLKTFYQIGAVQVSAYSGSSQFVTFTDNGSYIDPQGSNYTTSGVLQLDQQPRMYTALSATSGSLTYMSMPPPTFIWQCGAKGRTFGLCQTFGQHRLYYTSQAQDRFPFEWHTYNYAPIPPDIGDVRSIDSIDDKIVIFGTRSLAVMNGDGPAAANSSGTPSPGDGFSLVQPIPTPVGVVGTGSPARIPDGVVFQGFSGVQIVGRDITVGPIGAPVDRYTGRQVNNPGVVLGRPMTLAALQSVVWCNPSGAPLVFNYLTKKWSMWPVLANTSAIVQRLDGAVVAAIQPVIGGRYLGAATATTQGADMGVLGASWSPVYQGNATQPGMVLETPWLLPSGESGGEAQIWDATVTGTYLGPHILQVEQAYDYVANYVASTQFNVTQDPGIYQYRVRPKSAARCWAVRYRITLLPISSLSTGWLMATIGDLVLNFGTKQGTTRLSAAASG